MKIEQFYLEQALQWLNLSEDATIVDLGAWNGTTPYLFSLKAQKGKVIAVEPVKETMALCIERCKDRNNVIFCPYAISDKIGETDINIYKNRSDSNSLFLKRKGKYEFEKTEKVETITWDRLVEIYGLDRVDFCKANIEGAETLLLKGMTKAFPEKMIIEQHYRLGIVDKNELTELIKQKGYKIEKEYRSFLYCLYERKS